MSDKFEDSNNISNPIVVKDLMEKHFYKSNRIEEVFYKKFLKLRQKINKVLKLSDDLLDYDVYVDSILVDCRAIFLETKNRKSNSTLQNSYRARNLDDLANEIDEFFERKINGKTLNDIIKAWVDKRVVHYDYLEPTEEEIIFDNISSILDRETLNNLFNYVLVIALQYEMIKNQYGKNSGEQFDKGIEALIS